MHTLDDNIIGCVKFRSPRDCLHIIMCGTLGTFLNQLCFIEGLKRTSAFTASIFQPLTPIVACAIAVLAGVESLGSSPAREKKLAGMLVASGGALYLTLTSSLDTR